MFLYFWYCTFFLILEHYAMANSKFYHGTLLKKLPYKNLTTIITGWNFFSHTKNIAKITPLHIILPWIWRVVTPKPICIFDEIWIFWNPQFVRISLRFIIQKSDHTKATYNQTCNYDSEWSLSNFLAMPEMKNLKSLIKYFTAIWVFYLENYLNSV